jgi:hypothetical protein
MNRQDACSTRIFTLCGTGILPVLENGARCEFQPNASYETGVETNDGLNGSVQDIITTNF